MPHQPEQQVRAGADQIAQPDPAVVRGHSDQVVHRCIDPMQGITHLRQPGLTEFGQRHLTGGAGEQHDTELVLELFDRRRQGGLGDEQSFGGAPIVQLFAEHGEVAQLAQCDVTARGRFLPARLH